MTIERVTENQAKYIRELITNKTTNGTAFESELKTMLLGVHHWRMWLTKQAASQFIDILKREWTLFDVAAYLDEKNLFEELFTSTKPGKRLPTFARFIKLFFDMSTDIEGSMDDEQEKAFTNQVLASLSDAVRIMEVGTPAEIEGYFGLGEGTVRQYLSRHGDDMKKRCVARQPDARTWLILWSEANRIWNKELA